MIGTSYYGNDQLEEMNECGVRLVSISRSTPAPFDRKCSHYSPLKPSWELINHWKANHNEEYYRKVYGEILSRLDPHVVYETLNKSIILCYEGPNQFCHRHLVAEWLRKFDYKVVEI